MKYKIQFLIVIITMLSYTSFAQYSKFFTKGSLRVDYFHVGTDTTEYYAIDELIVEPLWGGSTANLVDVFQYGKYKVEVVDVFTEEVIYSRGYCTLFGEWQTTAEAKKTQRCFSESFLLPMPKKDVRLLFYSRSSNGDFIQKFAYDVDMDSYFLRRENQMEYPSFEVWNSGDPAHKVDVVILPEGYTKEEMGKFIADCQQFKEDLFTFEPWKTNDTNFNIRAILAPSEETGTDIPGKDIWKNTILDSRFYTFDSERYLTTMANKKVRNLAANAPYDQIYILINSTKYGGGGIYNFYSTSVNSNSMSAKIIIHEFGHAFAGLADEYFDSSTAYSDFYPLGVEPWEPNITTLVDFESKWADLLPKRCPIPTPIDSRWAEKDKLGVYEGGGYSAKGVYRPKIDCLMHTFKGDHFCGACQSAIQKMIDYTCGKPMSKKSITE